MYDLSFDTQWLLWINAHHSDWADWLMWMVSRAVTWLPLYVLMMVLLWRKFGWRRAVVCLLVIGLSVGLADWVSSSVLKPFFHRLRPTHEPSLEGLVRTLNGYTGGLYGFVSSHAANTLVCAYLFARIYREKWMSLLLGLYVILNCYSRMYLGVHYPCDILGGLIVGFTIAWLVDVLVLPHMDRAEAVLFRRQA